MIKGFGNSDPRQEASCCHAAIDDGGRYRFCDDGFAAPAGVLWADVAVQEEFGGFDVELFSDVFADFGQHTAALLALARCRFMTMLDTRLMIRQWLAAGTNALRFFGLRQRQLVDFRFNGRYVSLVVFIEQT